MNKLGIAPARIRIDKKTHTYTHTVSGDMYTGVTTILGVRGADWLKFWTTKENYNYMMSNWDIGKTYTQTEKEQLLYEAKTAHTRKSKAALSDGKIAHQWIEHYLAETPKLMPESEKAKNAILAFLDFEIKHNVEWLLSEFIVASEVNRYAGTLDAYAKVDGLKTLIDFKTSNHLNDDVFLQTAGYQIALEEMGEKPDRRMVIRLPKDGGKLEIVTIPSDLTFDKQTFLSLRQAHRWNLYTQRFRDNGIIS